jgi:hypothetical protein
MRALPAPTIAAGTVRGAGADSRMVKADGRLLKARDSRMVNASHDSRMVKARADGVAHGRCYTTPRHPAPQTTPRQTTPRQTTPRQTTPRHPAPQTTPPQTTPRQTAPRADGVSHGRAGTARVSRVYASTTALARSRHSRGARMHSRGAGLSRRRDVTNTLAYTLAYTLAAP